MPIVTLTEELMDPAYDLFDALAQQMPHAIPVYRSEFHEALRILLAREPVRLAHVEDRTVTAFALGLIHRGDGESHEIVPGDASLFFLFCRSVASGTALLTGMMRDFQSAGASRVVAFDVAQKTYRLPFFNGGFPACPETLPVTPQVLTQDGFGVAYRELHMTCELSSAALEERSSPPLPDGIVTRWTRADVNRLEIQAECDGQRIGECIGHMMSTVQSHPAATERGYITQLHVDSPYRRRGIGRTLLRQMMRQMADLGARYILLTTAADNFRAQPLYLSLGYAVVGTSISLSRDIGDQSIWPNV